MGDHLPVLPLPDNIPNDYLMKEDDRDKLRFAALVIAAVCVDHLLDFLML